MMNALANDFTLADFQLLMAKYNLDSKGISKSIEELKNFHVTAPLVGKFSTGKSSLVNALLGRRGLSVGTAPETSIPTEIMYGPEDTAVLIKKNWDTGKIENSHPISMDEVLHGHFDVSEWSALRLTLHDSFLATVPHVRIVDMPGFSSGNDLHNRALNEYLPESKAYILTFSARNSTLEADTLEFLKELKFHDMPVYVLVTKSKFAPEEELTQCVENLKDQLTHRVGLKDSPIYCTSAVGRVVDVAGFRTVLEDLEQQSGSLRDAEVKRDVKHFGSLLKTYLTTAISKNSFNAADLEAEKGKYQKKLADLKEKLKKEKSDFRSQIPVCIQSISDDVKIALEDFAEEYADLAIDSNKEKIRERINSIIQTKVGEGIKNTFAPQVRNYLSRISSAIRVDAPDMDINYEDGNNLSMLDGLDEEMVKKAILALLAKLGLKIPYVLVQVLAVAIMLALKYLGKKSQKAGIKEKIVHLFRTEAVSQIGDTVRDLVETLVNEQADKVDAAIEENIASQMESVQKALDDLIKKASEEKAERAAYLVQLEEDLEQVNRALNEAEV